ncbi:putative MFS-type transporter, partial [Neolecta irregularis DAH-3]
ALPAGTARSPRFSRRTRADRAQPSEDPRDPLNWPLWQRDVMFALLCGGCVMAATLGPILATNTFILLVQYRTTFAAIASLTGYQLVGVAAAAPLLLASSRIYGKRHAYVAGCVCLFGSTVWAAEATTYRSLLGARILQGVGILPFEALLVASVGDLYFVHQRGLRIAVASLALVGTTFLTPIVVGRMTRSVGWRWSFRLVALGAGLFGAGVFFYGPEHVYPRAALLPGIQQITEKQGTVTVYPCKPQSYARSLALVAGRKSPDALWKLVLRPFPLFLTHPAIIWMVGAVVAALYIGPPHWLNEVHIGYLYTAPFVGSIVAFALLGLSADWSVKCLIRRNNNIYEPEFRIVQIIPGLIIGSI